VFNPAAGLKSGQFNRKRNFASGKSSANRRDRWARRGFL